MRIVKEIQNTMKRQESEEKVMTAQEFYRAFQDSLSDEWFKSDYQNSSKWTRRIDNIVEEIISNDGLSFEKEYYRIDYIGWKDRKSTIVEEANQINMKPCLWDLRIAVEHENDQADWTYELVKLVHISCPLKVVIGYSPCDERNAGGLEEQRLEYAAKLMSKVEAFKNTSGDEYLVILGNASPKSKSNPTYYSYDYRGYVFDKGKFYSI